MKLLTKCLLVCVPFIGLVACGGSDTEDRLDVADPKVRFVHASPLAPNVTLYRNNSAQADATNTAYKFASNYFDVETGTSQWAVKTAQGNATVGDISIDAKRGNKYTIVALPTSNTENGIYEIRDPYNKSLTSDKAKLRIMNASFNASNIDLYVNTPGTDISATGVIPVVAATAYKTSGPATGNDSLDIAGGNYQIVITTAGTKTILFKGTFNIENNKDILLLTVPSSVTPSAIKTLVKIEGTAGANELASS
jgi:Domain of unknown function (DUF4397)